jgi:hypothetical protein
MSTDISGNSDPTRRRKQLQPLLWMLASFLLLGPFGTEYLLRKDPFGLTLVLCSPLAGLVAYWIFSRAFRRALSTTPRRRWPAFTLRTMFVVLSKAWFATSLFSRAFSFSSSLSRLA